MKKSIMLILVAVLLLSCLVGCTTEPAATVEDSTSLPTEDKTQTTNETTEENTTEAPAEESANPDQEVTEDGYQLNIADVKQVYDYEINGMHLEIPDVDNSGTGGLVLPLANNDVTLSVYRMFANLETTVTNPEEIICYDIIQENTGVAIDWTVYTTDEQFNIMIVSGDYPDMIWASSTAYTGGVDKAIEDEVYVAANDYFHLTPNYVRLVESDPEIAKLASTDSHNYMFTCINSGIEGTYTGSFIRTDWLEQVEMEIPVTYDDWYNVLVAFRDQLGATDAMFIDNYRLGAAPAFTAGYGTYAGFYAKEGTEVRYGYTDDSMKDYLVMLNKWWEADLLLKDYLNMNAMTTIPQMTSGMTGASMDGYYGYVTILPNIVPGSTYAAVPQPKINETDPNGHFAGSHNGITTDTNIYITTSAVARGVDELTAQWIDYRYSEEGSILLMYGIEDDTWAWGEDGMPHKISDAWTTHNYKGTQYTAFECVMTDPMMTYGCYNWKPRDYELKSVEELAPFEIWAASGDIAWMMPAVTMTAEEAELYREKYGDIETYVLENFARFLTGDRSLDEWDAYVADIENMGIQDCIDCYQAALDRFNAR